jgi:hypothetical protein
MVGAPDATVRRLDSSNEIRRANLWRSHSLVCGTPAAAWFSAASVSRARAAIRSIAPPKSAASSTTGVEDSVATRGRAAWPGAHSGLSWQ